MNRKVIVTASCFMAVMIIALILRVQMFNYSRPFLFHIDEYSMSNAGMENLKYSRLDPHFYVYPPFTYFFFTAVDYLKYESSPALKRNGVKALEPKDFYGADRAASIAMGVLATGVIFFLGYIIAGLPAAILAGLFLAFSPAHVDISWVIKPDSLMVFLALTSFLMLNMFLKNNRLLFLFFASVFAAAATLAKYNALALFIPLTAVILKGDKKQYGSSFAVLFSGLFLTLALTLPVFKSYPELLSIFYLTFTGYTGNAPSHFPNMFFMQYIAGKGMGIVPALAGFAALLYYTFTGSFEKRLMPLLVWPYLLVLFSMKVNYEVHTALIIPFLYLATACLITEKLYSPAYLFYPASMLILAFGIYGSIMTVGQYLKPDTRVIARDWILKNIPAGSPLIYEEYGPPLTDYDPAVNANHSLVDPARDVTYMPAELLPENLAGYRYFALSSFGGLNDRTLECGEPVAEFKPESVKSPLIRIYKNISCFDGNFEKKFTISFMDHDKWKMLRSDRDIHKASAFAGKHAVFSFDDTERKEGYHYFIQHADLNISLAAAPPVIPGAYLETAMKWDNSSLLFVAVMDENNILHELLSGKRGLGKTETFHFPMPPVKIKSIVFSLCAPQNKPQTGEHHELVFSGMGLAIKRN